jgi:DNA-binding YbaB/EbfC family protein
MSDELDLGALLDRAKAMQEQLMDAQAAAADQVVEGQAGGGAVRVRMTGGMEFRSVFIDPAAIDPDDPTLLEDLVLAACNDAVAKAQELAARAVGDLDLGGLTGLGS